MSKYSACLCECGQVFDAPAVWPYRCVCGEVHNTASKIIEIEKPVKTISPRRQVAKERLSVCQSNDCGHFGTIAIGDDVRTGCLRLRKSAESPLPKSDRNPCRTFEHLYYGGGCLADAPLFLPLQKEQQAKTNG